MGYSPETRNVVRSRYIYDRLSLPAAAEMAGVSYACARTWKRKSLAEGDDWDRQRLAYTISAEGVLGVARKTLEDYLVQHQATMEALKADTDLPAGERAAIMSRLADSYQKVIKATQGLTPEVSKMSIAMEIVKLLTNFVKKEYPQHAPLVIDVLGPFAGLVARTYG